MKRCTIPGAVAGLLLAVAGAALAQRPAGRASQPPDAAAESYPVRMVVGDRIDAAIRHTDATRIVRRDRAQRLQLAATFTSSNTAVLRVDGSILHASAPGTATVTSSAPLGDSSFTGTTVFHVVTPRQEVNTMVVDVCPNDDEENFLRLEPMDEEVPAIHEFHDCQRLIEGGRYGPLVGVFAHGNVGRVASWQDFRNEMLVAVIVNFGGADGAAAYPSLGIAPGVSCLYLQATSATAWRARMVGQSQPFVGADSTRHYGRCDRVPGAASPETPLTVQLQEGVDMTGRPRAPAAARWDWDARSGRNYIGVKCGTATWCEVGPRGFAVSPPRMVRSRLDMVLRRDGRPIVKGYYDEQFLADSLVTRPTTVFGTIMPGRDATTARRVPPRVGAVLHVAQLTLHERGAQRSGDYRRYARAFTGDGSPDGLRALGNLHLRYIARNETDLKYEATFNGRALPARAVVFRNHSRPGASMAMPVTRWRWGATSEKPSSYCAPAGGCETIKSLQ